MKLLPTFHRRRWILAAMVAVALSCGARYSPLSTTLQAQTSTPAPSGMAGGAASTTDMDKETGKPIVTTPSGLKYVDITVGTGSAIKTGDRLSVTYVGKLLDGTKFDASADHGGTFDYVQGVTSLIPGWTEGTSTMKVGGERKLIIPPQLGYGQAGAGDAIPPNATLIFDIKIVAVNPS